MKAAFIDSIKTKKGKIPVIPVFLTFLLVMAGFIGGCAPREENVSTSNAASQAAAEESSGQDVFSSEKRVVLTVFAAASLTESFQAAAEAFEAEHSSVEVRLNFAGSSTLLAQMKQGAPADIFASADMKNMQEAQKAALVDEYQVFASNSLVLVTPADNPAGIREYQDLTKAQRVILGVEALPIGQYARQSLQKADRQLGERFSQAVHSHVVSMEDNVKQIVNKIALGEGDMAFVYVTDVKPVAQKVQVVEIPGSLNVYANYPIAVLNRSEHSEWAETFVQFLLSDGGQTIMQTAGFQSPAGNK